MYINIYFILRLLLIKKKYIIEYSYKSIIFKMSFEYPYFHATSFKTPCII